MKNTSDELIQKKREFGQIFFYSVAGVLLFYLLLGILQIASLLCRLRFYRWPFFLRSTRDF